MFASQVHRVFICCLPSITVGDSILLIDIQPRACHECVLHAMPMTDIGLCRSVLPGLHGRRYVLACPL